MTGTPRPEIDWRAIAAEIRALRRGRGMRGDVAGRIGPLLSEFAGAGPAGDSLLNGAGAAQDRAQLAHALTECAARLPDDLRKAVLAALALQPQTQDMRTYEERRDWLAGQIDRGARTAERRIETAQKLLAQEIAADLTRQRAQAAPPGAGGAGGAWHFERFSAVFLLDGDQPEALETRVIVSHAAGLTEIGLGLDVPVDSGQPRLPVSLDMISGGELIQLRDVAQSRTQYVIRLPRPLLAGEAHEYRLRVRVVPGKQMRDYYIFRPEHPCDRFDLRVRFNRGRPPAWVRRVDGEDVRVYDTYAGPPGPAELVSIDDTGEAAQDFTALAPHYGFGLQWGWS